MDNSLRSSDVYYRDRQPIIAPKTVPMPTYRQSSNESSSNNKYYAEMATPADTNNSAKMQLLPAKEVELELFDNRDAVTIFQNEFKEGATYISVKATEAVILQLQVAVDMAVGRNELTRNQVDSIAFVATASTPIVIAPKVPLVKETTVSPKSTPEAADIINAPAKPTNKKAKREITMKDIAAAFDVDDSDA